MLADDILAFLKKLKAPGRLPKEVNVLNPYRHAEAMALCQSFYYKYYADDQPRHLIIGINPGRFGGGVTGIPFTDPIRLERECKISNDLEKKPELSSDFIYQMINAYGGTEKFYRKFYISSVSPLGFTKAGKNLNYYDTRDLEESVRSFILSSMRKQLAYGLRTDFCFCLGEGQNFNYLSRLNDEHHFFEQIIPLAHPRFILQYRRKLLPVYIADYLKKLEMAGS